MWRTYGDAGLLLVASLVAMHHKLCGAGDRQRALPDQPNVGFYIWLTILRGATGAPRAHGRCIKRAPVFLSPIYLSDRVS